MKKSNRILPFVLSVFAVASFVGCSSGSDPSFPNETPAQLGDSKPAQAKPVALCDVIRRQARVEALKDFGVSEMIARAKKISAEISTEDTEDLAKLTAQLSEYGTEASIRTQTQQLISDIYRRAADRSTVKIHVFEPIPKSGRSVLVAPGWLTVGDSTTIAFTEVLGGDGIGSIGEVYLSANPDQTRYKIMISEYARKGVGADGAPKIEGAFIGLSQYVESRLTEPCKGVGSALNPADFDTVAGPGIGR